MFEAKDEPFIIRGKAADAGGLWPLILLQTLYTL